MKVALKKLIESREALQWLSKEKLPIMAAYRLGKGIKLINNELQNFEDMRVKEIKELSDGSGTIPDDKAKEFSDKMMELLDMEVVLDMESISLGQLPQSMSAAYIMALDWLIEV